VGWTSEVIGLDRFAMHAAPSKGPTLGTRHIGLHKPPLERDNDPIVVALNRTARGAHRARRKTQNKGSASLLPPRKGERRSVIG